MSVNLYQTSPLHVLCEAASYISNMGGTASSWAGIIDHPRPSPSFAHVNTSISKTDKLAGIATNGRDTGTLTIVTDDNDAGPDRNITRKRTPLPMCKPVKVGPRVHDTGRPAVQSREDTMLTIHGDNMKGQRA